MLTCVRPNSSSPGKPGINSNTSVAKSVENGSCLPRATTIEARARASNGSAAPAEPSSVKSIEMLPGLGSV